MIEEPEDEIDGGVAREVVPDQEQPERWEILGQGDADGAPLLPTLPAAAVLVTRQHLWLRQGGQDRGQFGFQPGMEDGVGAVAHPFDPDLPSGGMEQGQLLGRPLPRIFMGIPDRVAGRVPVRAGIRNRLVGPASSSVYTGSTSWVYAASIKVFWG